MAQTKAVVAQTKAAQDKKEAEAKAAQDKKEAEAKAVEAKAAEVAGGGKITNEITVKGDSAGEKKGKKSST